jgi:hypothetical protein
MAKPRRFPNLPNVRFPLIVGCIGKQDFAFPDKYSAPLHAKITVIALTKCSMIFDDHDVFEDVHLHPGANTLRAKCDNGTAHYRVVCGLEIVSNTHPIVVGSGIMKKKKNVRK